MSYYEAHIQTAEPQAGEQARFPEAHEHQGRSEDFGPAPESRQISPGGEGGLQVGMNARTPPSNGASEGSFAFRFPRSRRVRNGSEIRPILREGRRKRTSHLDVFFAANPTVGPRFGLVVPKHRRRVVDRNRLRRRLRELGRVELLPALEAQGVMMDVLIRARTEAYEAPFGVLQAEMREVAEALCSGRWSWP